jgi:hypothetical protein
MAAYDDWALSKVRGLSVPTSSYNTMGTTPSSQPLPTWYLDGSTKYIVDQGRAVAVTAALAGAWSGVTFTTGPTSLFGSLPKTTLQANVWTNPSIYVLSGGKKHHVPTAYDYSALRITPGITTSLRADKLIPVAQGSDALGSGKVIGLLGDISLYVVNGTALMRIANPAVFSAYGFGWSSIPTYPGSLTADYPVAAASLRYGKSPDAAFWIPYGSAMLRLTNAQASDYGLIAGSFADISALVPRSAKPAGIARFMYNVENGRIYYASGGAIHYVTSWASFAAYGGNSSPVTPVNSDIIQLFLIAQPI